MELLKNWLNGSRNYTVGKVLYNQFGDDDSIKKQLETGKNDFTKKLLIDSIIRLVNGQQQQKEPEKVNPVFDEMPEVSDDKVLIALKDEWMPIYTNMNYKRHQLDMYLDDETEQADRKRGLLAQEILSMEKQCIAIWQKRDHYLKYKTLPGKSIDKEPVIDNFKAAQRINNLKIYVRRYSRMMKANPADSRAAELLTQYEAELKTLQHEFDQL